MSDADVVVRAPASSANLGAGFDVFGMALDLYADLGTGTAPADAQQLDDHHPGRHAFDELGGSGPVWLRCNIPMARGLGFSGAVRVAAAALAAVQSAGGDPGAIGERRDDILEVTTRLEGHGDNVAASLIGGVTAYVQGMIVPFPLGPKLADAAFIAWVPDVTTSTDRSRKALPATVERAAAVHNIGRSVQFALAFAHDDPALLELATTDLLHQRERLEMVPGAREAMAAGIEAGAWCTWLSGSGPTVGFLTAPEVAETVAAAMPGGAHAKVLRIDPVGARVVSA